MVGQIALLGLESIIVSLLLLTLYWLRPLVGFSGLYLALGSFQFMQVLLALSVYIEIMPGLLVSPGSAVLFTASLFAVLLIYIEEDAIGARKLIYGLALANITLSLLALLFSFHLDNQLTRNFFNLPTELFLQSPRIWIIGTIVLVVDTILLILIFEMLARYLARYLFIRIFLSMTAVLIIDTFLFVTGSFFERPEYGAILISGLVGKCTMGLFYSMTLTIYLRFFHKPWQHQQLPINDLFGVLTYRQRYEKLREISSRDSLTGIYNRASFDQRLPQELIKSTHTDQPASLLLMDLDEFKTINDIYGHQQGDRILTMIGKLLQECSRPDDLPCRYGGDEFALIMPNTRAAAAETLARRINEIMKKGFQSGSSGIQAIPLSAAIGVAEFPTEASSATDLISLADQRLYREKRLGRAKEASIDTQAP